MKRAAFAPETVSPCSVVLHFCVRARDNAYAQPSSATEFVIHDWHASLAEVDSLIEPLQAIEDQFKAASFFTPKDPVPWLPVLTQITFLMITMGGWIKSYHSDKAFLTISVLVIPSMLVSIALVLYSKDTFWNIARQSLVPGAFILFWIAKNKGWLSVDQSNRYLPPPPPNKSPLLHRSQVQVKADFAGI